MAAFAAQLLGCVRPNLWKWPVRDLGSGSWRFDPGLRTRVEWVQM